MQGGGHYPTPLTPKIGKDFAKRDRVLGRYWDKFPPAGRDHLKTGEQRWSGRGPGKGSIIYADGMLYCLGEKGKMGLVEASPEVFKLISMFDLPTGEGPCWTHPVIAGGKLYLRWNDNLYIHDIKQ